MRKKNNIVLTSSAFFLSLLGLIGPGFWKINSPNPFKVKDLLITRSVININPNSIKLDNKFSNQPMTSKKIFGKEIAIAWSNNFLAQLKKNNLIPKVFFTQLPSDLSTYNVKQRKSIFISIMLPLLIEGNLKVQNERDKIKSYFKRKKFNKILFYCKKYKIKKNKCSFDTKTDKEKMNILNNKILQKVNKFPISMMLAQAIIESGWGTSRFAQEGNALFGQWTWKKNDGILPKNPSYSNFSVKSFRNLQHSVNSYILNLNTHRAYTKLRNYRKLMMNYNKFKGKKFSKYLDKYAEIGFRYVLKINKIIDEYNLESYNKLAFIQETN